MNNQLSIPQEIKDFAQSTLLAEKVEKIGADLGLHIDQIGELDSLIRQALLGMVPREILLKKIVENLEVEPLAGDRVLKAVNTEVFMKLRELIIETHQENHAAIAEETLAHIEDPQPTQVPINKINVISQPVTPPVQAVPQPVPQPVPTAQPTLPVQKPAPAPVTPTNLPVETQPAPTITTAQVPSAAVPHDVAVVPGEVAHDAPHPEPTSTFQSLTTPVNNPITGEVKAEPKVEPKPAAPRGYDGVDPYREPIN